MSLPKATPSRAVLVELRRQMRLLALLASIVFATPAAVAQTFRCELAGKVLYQQSPCPADAAKAREIKPPPPPPTPRPKPNQADTTRDQGMPRSSDPSATLAPTNRAAAAKPSRSQLEFDADRCLDWYRPNLRNPRGAYWMEASRDQRVLTITVYATNGYGGYVSKIAACEVNGGKLDDDWTKIHAKRLGW